MADPPWPPRSASKRSVQSLYKHNNRTYVCFSFKFYFFPLKYSSEKHLEIYIQGTRPGGICSISLLNIITFSWLLSPAWQSWICTIDPIYRWILPFPKDSQQQPLRPGRGGSSFPFLSSYCEWRSNLSQANKQPTNKQQTKSHSPLSFFLSKERTWLILFLFEWARKGSSQQLENCGWEMYVWGGDKENIASFFSLFFPREKKRPLCNTLTTQLESKEL